MKSSLGDYNGCMEEEMWLRNAELEWRMKKGRERVDETGQKMGG